MATEQHDKRREEIIQTAAQLFFGHGYDNTSIAQIIDAVGIAKGTFYHYFGTKDDLLAELVENRIAGVMQQLRAIARDRSLTGHQKLTRYFLSAGAWKADNREIMLSALYVLYRDENTMLLKRLQRRSLEAITPEIASMIQQGIDEGEFDTEDAGLCAEYILGAWAAVGEVSSRTLLATRADPASVDELRRRLDFAESAMNRVLGSRAQPVRFYERATLQRMFGDSRGQEDGND